jgi:methionine sulfoxide reductase heme-binding subunit
MLRIDPTRYIWWLVSRSAGIVALGLVAISVLIGLTMATKIVSRPGLGKKLVRLHEHVALVALSAMAVHGVTLLGDTWLKAGVRGLVVPFTMGYRPLYTGLGMVGAYLAALLGLSFYLRRRIGTKLWRKLHRATVLVWVLGVVHTLGAGSDAGTVWLRMFLIVTGAPIVFLFLVRILGGGKGSARPAHPARVAPAGVAPAALPHPADVRRHPAAPVAVPAAVGPPPYRLETQRDDHTRRARSRPAVGEDGG